MVLSPQDPHYEERSQPPHGHEACEARFLALARERSDVFWLLTPEGSMQEVGPSWHTFTSQDERSALGKGWLDTVHPADQPPLEQTLRHVVNTGQTQETECHLRKHDGAYHLVRVRAIPVRFPDEATRELVLCATDLSTQEPTGEMSDAQVQLAVKASGVGMWEWDLRSNQIMWNEQMKALFGLPPDAPTSYERFLEGVHPEDRARVDHLNAEMRKKAQEYHRHYRVIWPDGSVHWLSSNAQSLADASGTPLLIVGATIDITESKHAEERITTLLDHMSDAFVHVDPQWHLTYLNRQAERYLGIGVSREDVLGRSLWKIIPELLGTSIEQQLREAMATLQTRDFDAVGPRTHRWLEVHVYPASDGLSAYFHDIDERKRAEAALRQSREELRLLVDIIPQLAWTARPDGFLDEFNQPCYTYLNATREDLMGDRWLYVLHPEDRQRTLTHWRQVLQAGQGSELECRLREGKTGIYHWFLLRSTPLTDRQGHILKWFGTATDIDGQKKAEDALRESRDAFRLLTEALPQLVWTARSDGAWDYANQRWYAYTGRSAKRTLGEG